MRMRSYKDLLVWQKAMQLCKQCYEVSACFPQEERYGLTQQLRRSAVSVPSNIAEGQGRDSDKEFLRFLNIAMGSLHELETQLLIARSLDFIVSDEMKSMAVMIEDVGNLIGGLKRKLTSQGFGESDVVPFESQILSASSFPLSAIEKVEEASNGD